MCAYHIIKKIRTCVLEFTFAVYIPVVILVPSYLFANAILRSQVLHLRIGYRIIAIVVMMGNG